MIDTLTCVICGEPSTAITHGQGGDAWGACDRHRPKLGLYCIDCRSSGAAVHYRALYHEDLCDACYEARMDAEVIARSDALEMDWGRR